jgi:hypothetical protein
LVALCFRVALPPANPILGVEFVNPLALRQAGEDAGALRLVDPLGVASPHAFEGSLTVVSARPSNIDERHTMNP